MNMAEKVFEEIRTLPEIQLREVLDFVGFLKIKHGISVAQQPNNAETNWAALETHARELTTEPTKALDLELMREARGKVCTGVTWTRDELYERGLR